MSQNETVMEKEFGTLNFTMAFPFKAMTNMVELFDNSVRLYDEICDRHLKCAECVFRNSVEMMLDLSSGKGSGLRCFFEAIEHTCSDMATELDTSSPVMPIQEEEASDRKVTDMSKAA